MPAAYGPSQELDAGYERRVGFDGAARTVVSYKAHPEMVAAGAPDGLQVFSLTSGQRMNLGDQLQVEVGGRLEAVRDGQTGFASRPFLRVTAHPMGVWSLHYRMATDRGLQGFEDVTTGQSEVPVALVKNGRLAMETGRHQEVSVGRRAGRGTVEFAYYHDALGQIAVSGGGAAGPGETSPGKVPAGMLVDPTTGSFRVLATGYKTDGARLTVSAPLTAGLWVAAEYSTGDALMSETGGTAVFAEALGGLKAQNSQAATIAVKGRVLSYRDAGAGFLPLAAG